MRTTYSYFMSEQPSPPSPEVENPPSTPGLQADASQIRRASSFPARVRGAAENRFDAMKQGYREHREKVSQRRQARRERWEQFKEDYQAGGGIVEGLKQGLNWGLLSATLGVMGGGVAGGGIDGIMYALDTSGGPGSQPMFDMSVTDNPLNNPYLLVPLVAASVSSLALGGYVFYRGLMSPAYEGRRMREYHWEDYH